MADKKEKDLTKVSDAAYIRALDSNGNPVLISKADLAQVAAELIKQLGTRDLSPNKTYRLTVQYAVLFWVNGFSANNIVGFVGGNARQFKSLVGPLDGSHYKVYKDDYYFYIKTDVNTGLTICPFGYFGDLEIEETDVDVSGLVLLQ